MNAHSDDSVERDERRLNYELTFESLQNPRRRMALRCLTEQGGGPIRVGELADQICAWERQVEVAEIRPEARKSVYNSLTQTHLPHLSNRGIVEFDQATGTVELAANADLLSRYLPIVPSDDDRWGAIVLATTGVAGAFAIANWLGLFAPAIAPMVLNAVVVGLFLAVTMAYAVSVRT